MYDMYLINMISKTKKISEITKINATSGSFNILEKEPEIYSMSDLKKKHTHRHERLLQNTGRK